METILKILRIKKLELDSLLSKKQELWLLSTKITASITHTEENLESEITTAEGKSNIIASSHSYFSEERRKIKDLKQQLKLKNKEIANIEIKILDLYRECQQYELLRDQILTEQKHKANLKAERAIDEIIIKSL